MPSTAEVNESWAEYLLESIEKIIRMLLPGLNSSEPQSYSIIVIAVAWLAPIGALMVLPGAAG